MAFFHVFSQSAVTLLVLTTTRVSVLGVDTGWLWDTKYNENVLIDASTVRIIPPNVENAGHGVNILLGKPANEDTCSQSFEFGEPKDGHNTYQQLEGMHAVKGGGVSCETKSEFRESYWSSSSSTMESTYAGSSIGFERAITLGVTVPVKGIEVSVESEFRTAFSFSRSKETSVVENAAKQGLTSSAMVVSSRELYSVYVDHDNVVWGSSFLEDISNLTEDNILKLFFEYGTHLFNIATFGYTCHQNVFFESGYESSSYNDFMKKGTKSDWDVKGFKGGKSKDSIKGDAGKADEGFKYSTESMKCLGDSRTGNCGAINSNHLRLDEDPAIIGWELIPMWEVPIPGLTNDAKAMMKSKFEAVMVEYIKCAEQNCNGRGGCKTRKGVGKSDPINTFYDYSGSCICIGDNQGAKCNESPPSKVSDSFILNRVHSGTTPLDGYFNKYTWTGGMSDVVSDHEDDKEDRWFEFTNVDLKGHGNRDHRYGSYSDLRKTQDKRCGYNFIVTGIESYHENRPEDRKFKIRCTRYQYYKWDGDGSCKWTRKTATDNKFRVKCSDFGPNYVMTGMKSDYFEPHKDRWFQFRCCALKRTYPKLPAKTLT